MFELYQGKMINHDYDNRTYPWLESVCCKEIENEHQRSCDVCLSKKSLFNGDVTIKNLLYIVVDEIPGGLFIAKIEEKSEMIFSDGTVSNVNLQAMWTSKDVLRAARFLNYLLSDSDEGLLDEDDIDNEDSSSSDNISECTPIEEKVIESVNTSMQKKVIENVNTSVPKKEKSTSLTKAERDERYRAALDRYYDYKRKKHIAWKKRDNFHDSLDSRYMWFEENGEYVSENCRIILRGHIFVFTGLREMNIYSNDFRHELADYPIYDITPDEIKALLKKRGGEFRTQISGKTDYLVCRPETGGNSKVRAALEQRKKGHNINIILFEDFMEALGHPVTSLRDMVDELTNEISDYGKLMRAESKIMDEMSRLDKEDADEITDSEDEPDNTVNEETVDATIPTYIMGDCNDSNGCPPVEEIETEQQAQAERKEKCRENLKSLKKELDETLVLYAESIEKKDKLYAKFSSAKSKQETAVTELQNQIDSLTLQLNELIDYFSQGTDRFNQIKADMESEIAKKKTLLKKGQALYEVEEELASISRQRAILFFNHTINKKTDDKENKMSARAESTKKSLDKHVEDYKNIVTELETISSKFKKAYTAYEAKRFKFQSTLGELTAKLNAEKATLDTLDESSDPKLKKQEKECHKLELRQKELEAKINELEKELGEANS